MEYLDFLIQSRKDLADRRNDLMNNFLRAKEHSEFLVLQGRIKELDTFSSGMDKLIKRRNDFENGVDEGAKP
jgi:hypothetical protein